MADRRVRTLIVLLILAQTACALVDDVLEILKFGKEIGEDVINSWEIFGKPFNASGGVELPVTKKREREILARLAHVSQAIERVQVSVEKNSALAMLVAKSAGKGARLELRLHEMTDLLNWVAAADNKMRGYVNLQRDLERSTLESFAQWCVAPDPGALPGILERIHELITPPHKSLLGSGLLGLILNDIKVCGSNN